MNKKCFLCNADTGVAYGHGDDKNTYCLNCFLGHDVQGQCQMVIDDIEADSKEEAYEKALEIAKKMIDEAERFNAP